MYKTHQGLIRHVKAKHNSEASAPQSEFDWPKFCTIFLNAKQALANDECYPVAIRMQISNYQAAEMQKQKLYDTLLVLLKN